MANDLGKLLLLGLLGYSGYQGQKRQNKATEYDWQRQAERDKVYFDQAAREKADYERRTNAPIDAANWMKAQPGAPGYAPAPEVPMFPDMPTNITTGGSGRYQPGSPMPGPPPVLQQAGPAPSPWGTEEEAARALAGSGLSPEAMDIALGRLQLGLPSEAEKRQKELQGREDAEYNRTITVGGVTFPVRQLNEMKATRPELFKMEAPQAAVDDFNAQAQIYGFTPVTYGISYDDLEAKYNALESFAKGKKYNQEQEAPGKAAKLTSDYYGSLSPGMNITAPIPLPFSGGMATAPLPINVPKQEPSREGFNQFLGKQDPATLTPETFNAANELVAPTFTQQDKLALDAAKRETPIFEYRMGEDGIPYKVQTGVGTATEATTALRESLKALEVPSKIEGREVATEFKQWQMDEYLPAKMKIDSEYKDATIRLRQAGLELRAKGMEQSQERWAKTFNQRAAQWQAGFNQRAANEEWNRMVDTRNIARNDAGVLKAYIEVMSKEAATLAATNYKTEDNKWYSKQGLTEAEFKTKLAEVQGAIAEVMPDYEARVKELINSSGVGPMAPPTSGVTPPTTGAPTGLPTIDPKAERGRLYSVGSVEAKRRAKLKGLKEGTKEYKEYVDSFINEYLRYNKVL